MNRAVLKLSIPEIPPSNNKYMGRGSVGQAIGDYQDEKQAWAWLVKAAIKGRLLEPPQKALVSITYYFPTRGRRDPDNYSGKFILDGLTKAGAIIDDSFDHVKLVLDGKYDKENTRTEITIEEV